MFKLLARDNGYVHVCGHRGHSIGSPENTLAALSATRENGGTSAEIDCMLTADGEIVLMHDDFLDRTTDGHGLVSAATLAEIRKLDAGAWFDQRFAGERVPTLMETVEHAGKIGLGLVIEIKEFKNLDPFVDRLAEIVADSNIADQAVFISFDHMVLKSLKKRLPDIRTEGIVHARHADVAAVARVRRSRLGLDRAHDVPPARTAAPCTPSTWPCGCISSHRRTTPVTPKPGSTFLPKRANGWPKRSSTRSPETTSRSSPEWWWMRVARSARRRRSRHASAGSWPFQRLRFEFGVALDLGSSLSPSSRFLKVSCPPPVAEPQGMKLVARLACRPVGRA